MSTRNYRLDGVNTSVAIKPACRVKTTANITLSGTQTIDDIAVAVDDRVLVGSQTDAADNGIYVVKANAWERAKDLNGPRDVITGTFVYVNEGTANADTFWKVTSTDDPIVVGTSDLTITSISVAGSTGPQGPAGPAGADGTVDLSSLTNETTIDLAVDEFLMRDDSEGANNAITGQALFNAINVLTAETAVDKDDSVPVYDATGSQADKATVANLFKAIDTLDSATPATDDEILLSDTDDSGNAKKAAISGILSLLSSTGGIANVQFFTSSGTYTRTANVTKALVIVVGGGGGSGGYSGNGGTGGTTSFGAHCQATGGVGGESGPTISTDSVQLGGAGGVGSGGDLNITGQDGFSGFHDSSAALSFAGSGGSSIFGGGGRGAIELTATATSGLPGNLYGGGGGGGADNDHIASAGGGGGGASIKWIASGISATETVTIGAGGAAGSGGNGTAGAAGCVLVIEVL